MARTLEQLLEELNQRLGDVSDDPGPEGADDLDTVGEEEAEEAYPIDFGPLTASLNKVFGKEAFLRPPKENDELLCAYFTPEAYHEHAEEFNLEQLQDWCYDKGFAVVSRMQDDNVVKVYFTSDRLLDDNEGKGEDGKEFSKAEFEKNKVGEKETTGESTKCSSMIEQLREDAQDAEIVRYYRDLILAHRQKMKARTFKRVDPNFKPVQLTAKKFGIFDHQVQDLVNAAIKATPSGDLADWQG